MNIMQQVAIRHNIGRQAMKPIFDRAKNNPILTVHQMPVAAEAFMKPGPPGVNAQWVWVGRN